MNHQIGGVHVWWTAPCRKWLFTSWKFSQIGPSTWEWRFFGSVEYEHNERNKLIYDRYNHSWMDCKPHSASKQQGSTTIGIYSRNEPGIWGKIWLIQGIYSMIGHPNRVHRTNQQFPRLWTPTFIPRWLPVWHQSLGELNFEHINYLVLNQKMHHRINHTKS